MNEYETRMSESPKPNHVYTVTMWLCKLAAAIAVGTIWAQAFIWSGAMP